MPRPERSQTPPRITVSPCGDPNTMLLSLTGVVGPADVPRLVERARRLLEDCAAARIVCDVADLVDPEAGAVDALARLRLAARHRGLSLTLVRPSDELVELLALVGLDGVLPPCSDL